MALTGACFRGSIKYQINGPVFDARSCHCSRCRKAFSSLATAYALVNPGESSGYRGAGDQYMTNSANETITASGGRRIGK
jgi:hypothetical protein